MANHNRNEINQPPKGEGKKQSLRAREPNKLIKGAERWQGSIGEQNLDKAEGIGRAVGHTNGQLRETFGWPMGY